MLGRDDHSKPPHQPGMVDKVKGALGLGTTTHTDQPGSHTTGTHTTGTHQPGMVDQVKGALGMGTHTHSTGTHTTGMQATGLTGTPPVHHADTQYTTAHTGGQYGTGTGTGTHQPGMVDQVKGALGMGTTHSTGTHTTGLTSGTHTTGTHTSGLTSGTQYTHGHSPLETTHMASPAAHAHTGVGEILQPTHATGAHVGTHTGYNTGTGTGYSTGHSTTAYPQPAHGVGEALHNITGGTHTGHSTGTGTMMGNVPGTPVDAHHNDAYGGVAHGGTPVGAMTNATYGGDHAHAGHQAGAHPTMMQKAKDVAATVTHKAVETKDEVMHKTRR